MVLYRISQEIFSDDLTGNGAKIYGGRWNSTGMPAVYAASSRSLALLETLAHTPAKMLQLKSYILTEIFIPGNAIPELINRDDLPPGWDMIDIHDYTTRRGDDFLLQNKQLLMAAPSVLMPEENIYVINPLHEDMKLVKIVFKRRIRFDRRVEHNTR